MSINPVLDQLLARPCMHGIQLNIIDITIIIYSLLLHLVKKLLIVLN